jgi:hypothetical protein
MKKKVSIFLMCTVALLTTFLIPIVYATPPEPASGTWTYALTSIETTKNANGNTFKYGEEIGTWTGTFVGISYDYFELVVHPKGFVTCQGRIAFDGSVNGESGTMDILFVGKKDLAAGLWSGKWVIIGGTGGLENLQGRGTWNGPSVDLDYSGMIHFNPKT